MSEEPLAATGGWDQDPRVHDIGAPQRATSSTNTVVHFFWNNGVMYCAFPPTMTYIWVKTWDHYYAIANTLNLAGVPYWDRPGDVDPEIYGRRIYFDSEDPTYVDSLTGGRFNKSQMLAYIDHHVNVGIPDLIKALDDRITVLAGMVAERPPYRLVRDAEGTGATGAVYAYRKGVFFHVKDGDEFAELIKLGLTPGWEGVRDADADGCLRVKAEMERGPSDIEDLYTAKTLGSDYYPQSRGQ